MAWGRRKFVGSASCPNVCDNLAAMGTADTPAEPMSGFTLSFTTRFMSLANRIPPIVPQLKAINPKAKIAKVE
jgi:hypothetical protein